MENGSEVMPLRVHFLFIAFFSVLCLWLGGTLIEQLTSPTATVAVSAPSDAQKPKISVAPIDGKAFNLPLKSDLSEMAERPLFFEGRRRPVEEAPPPAVAGEPPGRMILVGVVISPDDETALVKPQGGDEVIPVTVGQTINSWRLEEIHHDRILIRWEDRVEEINIEDNKPPPSAREPARKPAAASQGRPGPSRQDRRSAVRNRRTNVPGGTTR